MITIFPNRTPERHIPFPSILLTFFVVTFSALMLIASTYLGRVANGKHPTDGLSPLCWELPAACLWILLFPLIYYIVRRNPAGAGTRLFSLLAVHLFFALLFSASHMVLNILIAGLLFDAAGMPFDATNPWCPFTGGLRMSWRILFYSLIAATCYAVEFYYGIRTKELENFSLLRRLQATRLEQLKIRIDPTFVQRTLSDVGRLMQINTAAAVETVTRLGSFFRLVQNQETEITLAQHIRILRSYFRVESERSEGRVRAKIKIDREILKLRIPGLVLQPLINNFYRNRVGEKHQTYRLHIRISRKHNCIRLILRDNLPWFRNQQQLVNELRQTITDNCGYPDAYRIQEGLHGLCISYQPRFDRRSAVKPSVLHSSAMKQKAGQISIRIALWLVLSLLVSIYFFARRTLILSAAGNLTRQEITNLNVGLMLCGLSIPLILLLAKQIKIRSLTSIFLHSILAIVLALCMISMEIYLRAPETIRISWNHIFVNSGRLITLPDQILMYWGIVLLANAFWNYRKYLDEQIRTTRLQSDLSSAQLKALEMQLHPHFLFNTLHAINGLILTNSTIAIRMLTRLQHFLQMTLLSTEQHLVPFTQELKFLECYLDIQKIRFGDRLNVKMDIDPETLAMLVPQLILQPIVENAIRHGMSRKLNGGEIVLRARRQNGTLRIAVEDNGPGSTPGETGSQARTGVGLQNSALRLYHLYGNCQTFTYGNRSEGGFEVKMEIPLTA